MAVNVNVKKLKENATIPTYGTEYAAGADLYACIEEAVTITRSTYHYLGRHCGTDKVYCNGDS